MAACQNPPKHQKFLATVQCLGVLILMRPSHLVYQLPRLPKHYVPPTVLRRLEELGEKHRLKKGYTLFEVLARLPGQGVGMRVYQQLWERQGLPSDRLTGSYWHVAKVEMDTKPRDSTVAVKKVWGIKYVNGKQATPPHTIVQIENPNMLWLVSDDLGPGEASNTFYTPNQLSHLEKQDYGTDPATATLMEWPKPS